MPYQACKKSGEKRSNSEVGELGEAIARTYVRAHSGKVIYKNFQGPKGGELDIVAREGEILCFIEVKSRTSRSAYNRPMDAVDAKKRRYIVKGARAWLDLLKSEDMLWRYDVIEVILEEGKVPDVVWVKQAFHD